MLSDLSQVAETQIEGDLPGSARKVRPSSGNQP